MAYYERDEIRSLLQSVADGKTDIDTAMLKLRIEPFEDLGFAKPDYHRSLRQGKGEVIYGEGKTAKQITAIASAMIQKGQKRVLITRIDSNKADIVKKSIDMAYYPEARFALIGGMPKEKRGKVVVATGGTSDIPVAEEAALTAEAFGSGVVRLYDVGVAGIHRLLSRSDDIMSADAIVAVAGMEGALASVIGGIADCPVIAVPTSVGYGASFGGLSALLAMLNSCASGVAVVNIDNGFGAGYLASIINK